MSANFTELSGGKYSVLYAIQPGASGPAAVALPFVFTLLDPGACCHGTSVVPPLWLGPPLGLGPPFRLGWEVLLHFLSGAWAHCC